MPQKLSMPSFSFFKGRRAPFGGRWAGCGGPPGRGAPPAALPSRARRGATGATAPAAERGGRPGGPLEDILQHSLGGGDLAGDPCPVRRLPAKNPAHGLEQDAGWDDANVL